MSRFEEYDDEYNRDRNRDRDSDSDSIMRSKRDSSMRDSKNVKHDIPIINTTTLKINIKTIGDFNTKDYDLIPFHPNMADVSSVSKNNNYILFPSFVKVTMNDLKKSGVGSNYQDAFMDLDKYIELIKYVTNPKKEFDPTLIIDKSNIKKYAISSAKGALSTLMQGTDDSDMITIQRDEQLTDDEIVTNNIGIIKNLFLPEKGRFFILGNEYIIGKSIYQPPFEVSTEMNKNITSLDVHSHKIPLFYTIKIELQILDAANNPEVGDFGRMSCKAKKENLAKEAYEVLGTNFGYVEQKSIQRPSILNTSEVSKDRYFGKIQLEWEERNKYMREPTTERERLEMEKKMTPLQKRMVELERKQKELGEVPPLWEKDTNELNKKYSDFEDKIKELRVEYNDIEKNNEKTSFLNEMMKEVETKMYDEVVALGINVSSEDEIKNIKNELKNSNNNNILDINVIKKKKEEEKKIIDEKHVEPYIKKMKENKNVLNEMEEKEKNIKDEIDKLHKSKDPTDKYKSTSFKDKWLKYQAEIKSKKSTIEEMKNLYGENGEKLVQKWEDIIKKRKDLLKIVESEKSKESNQIKKSIVDDELKEKLREIQKLNKELLVAYFFEGELDKLTKKEIDEYDRKDKPTDNVSTIKANIQNLEDEYINISAKISDTEKFQALIKLYYEKLERIKYLKDGKQREKEKVDSKLKEIARTLRDLKSSSISKENDGSSDNNSSDNNNPQIKLQEGEQTKESEKFKVINSEYQKYHDIKVRIENNIKSIKNAIKENKYSEFDTFYSSYKDENYLNTSGSSSSEGGSRIHNKPKHKSKRNRLIKKKGLKNRYKTKRILNRVKNTKHKTLRRLKKRYRKRKYTIKQRKN